jgi:hypothetical protein
MIVMKKLTLIVLAFSVSTLLTGCLEDKAINTSARKTDSGNGFDPNGTILKSKEGYEKRMVTYNGETMQFPTFVRTYCKQQHQFSESDCASFQNQVRKDALGAGLQPRPFDKNS